MRALTIGAVVAALLTASPAIAQQAMPQDCPQMQGGMMGGGMMQGGMMQGFRHIEGQLAFLKTELRITDAQSPQWNAYAEARRANAARMHDLMSSMMQDGMMGQNQGMGQGQGMSQGQGMGMGMGMMGQGGMMMHPGASLPLPEHLALMEQRMSAHMEMIQAIKGPTLDLYGVLSKEQKETADELLMGHMGMR
ncbi:MAG: Spy/CpxP family protein refolding chaperone [Rhodospirillaceae bacterium]|nr:Spy/CpxP family protein refolding chaperone [Rhodospirillaceae bacterium]